jgi:hypothetical protein
LRPVNTAVKGLINKIITRHVHISVAFSSANFKLKIIPTAKKNKMPKASFKGKMSAPA